jgi:hypothetical protein
VSGGAPGGIRPPQRYGHTSPALIRDVEGYDALEAQEAWPKAWRRSFSARKDGVRLKEGAIFMEEALTGLIK